MTERPNCCSSCSVSATSVKRILPSAARSFKVLQIVVGSCPSFLIRDFNTLQYHLGSGLSVRIAITSIIEKYHFSCSSSHTVRTFLSSKSFKASCFVISDSSLSFHCTNQAACSSEGQISIFQAGTCQLLRHEDTGCSIYIG